MLHVYNKNEKAGPWWKTAQWSWSRETRWGYLTLAKGWWSLGRSDVTNYFELCFAVGGEDNMIQWEVVLPFLGRGSIGLHIPRAWTKAWLYQRREWYLKLGYIGRWIDVGFAFDDSARDMRSYYQRKREQGEGPEPWTWTALHPGWQFDMRVRPRDWLFGRQKCTTVEGESKPVVIPMPEGNYAGTIQTEDRTWQRPRWPWPSQIRRSYYLQTNIPVPGKGENSWDCEDDAVMGCSGRTQEDAIANATRSAMRSRERYGSGARWVPDAGWPEGIAR